jgi:hypothetical protein
METCTTDPQTLNRISKRGEKRRMRERRHEAREEDCGRGRNGNSLRQKRGILDEGSGKKMACSFR